jgi:hypothetical protein
VAALRSLGWKGEGLGGRKGGLLSNVKSCAGGKFNYVYPLTSLKARFAILNSSNLYLFNFFSSVMQGKDPFP